MSGILTACDDSAATENSIVNTEKHNHKMFNGIAMIVLAAVLLTAIGGIMIQRQGLPSMDDDKRIDIGNNLFQPELTQTSPTGMLVLNTGIILLLLGFGVILLLLVRFNLLRHNTS